MQEINNKVQANEPVDTTERVPAVIKGHLFHAVVIGEKPVCPHCRQAVPKSALIDVGKLAKLEERTRKFADSRRKEFRKAVEQANRLRKQRGETPLTEEQIREAEAKQAALFG